MPMPSILSRLFGERGAASAHAPSDTKSSRAAGLIAHMSMGLARWAPRNYVELTRHGYERNAIVYRSVRMIAEAAA
jgi:phage portal protein BeeE